MKYLICVSIWLISFNVHSGGYPVFDALGYGQKIISVYNQIKQFQQMKDRINYEINSAKNFLKNFKSTKFNNIDSLINKIKSFQYKSRRIGYTYNKIIDQFEEVYGKKGDLNKKLKLWEKQSNNSIKDAMVSQGLLKRSEKNMKDLDEVLQAKKTSTGNAETLQAIGEINAIQSKQFNDLIQIIATDARARQSVIMEKRAKQKAVKKIEKKLMKGFSDHKPSRPLAYFPSLGQTAPRIQK